MASEAPQTGEEILPRRRENRREDKNLEVPGSLHSVFLRVFLRVSAVRKNLTHLHQLHVNSFLLLLLELPASWLTHMWQKRIDAGIHFGILQDELGLAVFLRYRIIRLHLYRTQRLLPRHQVIRAIKGGQHQHDDRQNTPEESHNGFDILTKWHGSLVTTSGGNSPVPDSA